MLFLIIADTAVGAIWFKTATSRLPASEDHHNIDEYISNMCKTEKVSIDELAAGSRRKAVSGVRKRVAIESARVDGVALAEIARRVGVLRSAISKIIKRANQ